MTIFEKAGITPGPWRIGSLESYHGDTGIPFRCVYRDDNETSDTRIVVNGGEGENGAHYDCDADARLIAAAPLILEALIEAYKVSYDACYLHCEQTSARCGECGLGKLRVGKIKEAIEKATGLKWEQLVKENEV